MHINHLELRLNYPRTTRGIRVSPLASNDWIVLDEARCRRPDRRIARMFEEHFFQNVFFGGERCVELFEHTAWQSGRQMALQLPSSKIDQRFKGKQKILTAALPMESWKRKSYQCFQAY